jgi:imidazole glycerol-phosphate synthase subunit HisH
MSHRVTIIDYEFGNVRSVANALTSLGAAVRVSRAYEDLVWADGLVLPGVGAFEDGMANLRRLKLIQNLEKLVLEEKKPFLGICIGMQLLAKKGFENGEFEGLGWLDAEVHRFDVEKTHHLKVPHVGWNDVKLQKPVPWGWGPEECRSFYFVHSYYMQCFCPDNIIGICEYGIEFPAIIASENIMGVQFHPEKSQKSGLKLLKTFLETSAQPREYRNRA